MVKKRGTALLAIALLSGCLFYLTINNWGRLHPQFVAPEEVQLGRSLQAVHLPDSDKECSGGTLMYGKYCVVSPYENEVQNTSNGIVTLCTQGTVEFLHHVVVLCHRWSGPVSVAVYSPKDDYVDARTRVGLLRHCDSCVRYRVNWHFFFPKQTEVQQQPVDQSDLFQDCSSITQMQRPIKRKSRGAYPINVGRNVARQLTTTPFVFSTDIELYPSLDIPVKFERMVRSQVLSSPESNNQVWVLPVFEVHSRVRAPLLKSTLRRLYSKKQAISFHQYRCSICHRIPNLTRWMAHGERTAISEVEESLEPLKVWTTVKRNRPHKLQEWEPFFIGTTKDPEFDIRLTWEGKQNKMQMAYEMCMRNYDFHIVENAFLVHSPGINVYNASKEIDRRKYFAQNNRVIDTVKRNLIKKYGSTNDCR